MSIDDSTMKPEDLQAQDDLHEYSSGRLLKQKWSNAAIDLPEAQYSRYNTADTQELLVKYIHPRVVLVDRIWKWALRKGLSASINYAILSKASKRMYGEYCSFRKAIIKTFASRSKMTYPQRLALLCMFHSSLTLRTLISRYDAENRHEKWPSETDAQDFDFVVALSEAGMPLSVSNHTIASYSLSEWHTAVDLLTRAIAKSGALAESPVFYWDGLWDRYARLVHDLPGETSPATASGDLLLPHRSKDTGENANGPLAPPSDYLSLLEAFGVVDEQASAQVASKIPYDEMSKIERAALFKSRSPILDYPAAIEDADLPMDDDGSHVREVIAIKHENARLKFSFCIECESRYYALTTQFETLNAFLAASRERPEMMKKAARFREVWRSPARSGKSTMIKFILASLRKTDQNLQRYLRDSIWMDVGSVHLYRGQKELHLVMRSETLRARLVDDVTISEGIGKVSPERVIADMDMPSYQGMTKFLRDKQLQVNIVDGYLKHEDSAGLPPCLRSYAERISILAIARILDGTMILSGCKTSLIFGACTYIEELDENNEVPVVYPVTQIDALQGRGKNTQSTIVRVLRHNFVVIGGNSRVPTSTFEFPTFIEAVCFWLAFSRNIPLHHIPVEMHEQLAYIKNQMAPRVPKRTVTKV